MKDSDLHDLDFTRDYAVTVERLWQAITRPDQLAQWFGPEGTRIGTCDLDFTRTGPWFCIMIGRESGREFKASGQVTSVRPPEGGAGSVGLTWAWHDDTDTRGSESHVTFTVERTDSGARLILVHRGLPTVESAQDHSRGWLSTINSLDAFLGA